VRGRENGAKHPRRMYATQLNRCMLTPYVNLSYQGGMRASNCRLSTARSVLVVAEPDGDAGPPFLLHLYLAPLDELQHGQEDAHQTRP